ncbi:MAG TPA: hypothetical protein HA343_01140 [Methanomassiliicoccales archaeon]|nr:hypothetical protein [Methanomassiliicoccales archaeon]
MGERVGRKERRRRLPSILAAAIIVLLPLVLALMAVHDPAVSYPDGSGYILTDPVVDTDLSDFSSDVSITREGLVHYTRTPEGLTATMRMEGDAVRLHVNEKVRTVAISLNITELVRYQGNIAKVQFTFFDDASMASVLFEIGVHNTSVTYRVDDGISIITVAADLLLDRPDDADLLVGVNVNGITACLNGVDDTRYFSSLSDFEPQRVEMTVGAGNGINSARDITVFRLQASAGMGFRYVDTLHRTIVPDGKDFAFSLHIHADKAFIQQIEVMAYLSQEYGLKGTYDAWWRGNSQQYGMESPEHVAALHALQDSGWDIGIHAGSVNDLTREQVIAAIENMTAEFGPIRTWSDHGLRPQSLVVNGANVSSPNYVKDLVIDIGAGWWHDNTNSHSFWNDLNRDGMNYTLEGQEDLPLFRVSKQQALKLFFEDGRQEDVASWLRAMPVDRSVFVAHDYLPFFFYVSNDTGEYSVLPEHDGIENTPWSTIRPKTDFVNGTWQALPSFVELLEFLQDHDVWYATVRDVYDRSCLVQKVTVQETETRVIVTNFNSVPVKGLTLFTRDTSPAYHLMNGDAPVIVQKGASWSWHFVLDLEPGEILVLEKLSVETVSATIIHSVTSMPMIAVRESWPGA